MNSFLPVKGTAIEGLLPPEFVYDLGVYLQTCAHIELLASALTVCLRGLEPEQDDWFNEYCRVRKLSTKKLIKELRKSSEPAKKFGFSDDLSALADWIERFVQNRHMAAHGAFFGSPNGFLRVDYVTNTGSRKSPNYKRATSAVTQENIDEALIDANRIYHIVLGMIGHIQEDLPIRLHRAIVPIVEHPT